MYHPASEILEADFMEDNKIEKSYEVAVVEGANFCPKMFGYYKEAPDTTDYTFYSVKNAQNLTRKLQQLFQCHHSTTDASGKQKACDFTVCGLTKFFTHLRTHTNQKPYVCHYKGCGKSFTQKGNLKNHIELHFDIKKFVCNHCGNRYSKKYNL